MKSNAQKSRHGDRAKKTIKDTKLDALLYVISLMLWVGGILVGSQCLIGWILTIFTKYCNLKESYLFLIYSTLSYALAMTLMILAPKWIMSLRAPSPKKGRKKPSLEIKKRLANLSYELGLKTLSTWTDIGLAFVGYFAYLVIAFLLMSFFSNFAWFNANEAQNVGMNVIASKPEMIATFFRLVVVGPIAEEIIFRGYLYGKLRERLVKETSNIASILISVPLVSLLFAVVHGQWNVGVDVFALSIVLCLLREITGTIHASILLHMLKNGRAFYLIYIGGIGLFL